MSAPSPGAAIGIGGLPNEMWQEICELLGGKTVNPVDQ